MLFIIFYDLHLLLNDAVGSQCSPHCVAECPCSMFLTVFMYQSYAPPTNRLMHAWVRGIAVAQTQDRDIRAGQSLPVRLLLSSLDGGGSEEIDQINNVLACQAESKPR